MIQTSIVKLVQYGMATGLIQEEDKRYTVNKILELLKMDAIDEALGLEWDEVLFYDPS